MAGYVQVDPYCTQADLNCLLVVHDDLHCKQIGCTPVVQVDLHCTPALPHSEQGGREVSLVRSCSNSLVISVWSHFTTVVLVS